MTRRMGRNFHAFLKGVKRTATEVERDTSGEPSQNKKKLENWQDPNEARSEKNIFTHITMNINERKNTLSLTSHRGYEALPSIQLVSQTIQSPLDQC